MAIYMSDSMDLLRQRIDRSWWIGLILIRRYSVLSQVQDVVALELILQAQTA